MCGGSAGAAISNIKKAIKKAEDARRAPFEAARAKQAAEVGDVEEWVKRGQRELDQMKPEERWSSTMGPIPPTAANSNIPDFGDLVEDGLINSDTMKELGWGIDWKVLSKKQVKEYMHSIMRFDNDEEMWDSIGNVGHTGELKKLFMGRQDVPILNFLLWLGY